MSTEDGGSNLVRQINLLTTRQDWHVFNLRRTLWIDVSRFVTQFPICQNDFIKPERILSLTKYNHAWSEDLHLEISVVTKLTDNTGIEFGPFDNTFFTNLEIYSVPMNGRGRSLKDGRTHNNTPLHIFEMKQNIEYKFRIIGGRISFSF
ncbi:LOW QUALITY PROTEIN: hypothetical protein MAR_011363 [Mya arenaria]|uniref:Uncharacterized protein n=1 Tax=Mya arenaria TaxID=6604 RepID=A0ABY7FX04_MYAAR|nr:LOW QUALITY PROTEIN: hypothetical protein MAR_011363 [Mya arenaria]